jgi:hypothetical protein
MWQHIQDATKTVRFTRNRQIFERMRSHWYNYLKLTVALTIKKFQRLARVPAAVCFLGSAAGKQTLALRVGPTWRAVRPTLPPDFGLARERRYSSYSFNLGTRWGWVVSVTPRPRFTTAERAPGTYCTGGWVGPRAGLDAEARRPCRGSNPDRPVRSQPLYYLSYHGSTV